MKILDDLIIVEVGAELSSRQHLDGYSHHVGVNWDVLIRRKVLPGRDQLLADLKNCSIISKLFVTRAKAIIIIKLFGLVHYLS